MASSAALDCVLGREPLGEAGLARVPLAAVLEPRCLTAQQPARLNTGAHFGDHLLDQLVLADLLAKRLALVGVLERRIEARLGEAHRAGRNREAALVDRAHRDREALAFLADAVLGGHANVVEVDLAGIAGMDAELGFDGAASSGRACRARR